MSLYRQLTLQLKSREDLYPIPLVTKLNNILSSLPQTIKNLRDTLKVNHDLKDILQKNRHTDLSTGK